MAFSALKPCSRIMRASPRESDHQKKEAYFLLQEEEKEEDEEEEEEDEDKEEDRGAAGGGGGGYGDPHRTSFSCEDSLQQLLSRDPCSRTDQVPTFVAHQGSNNTVQLLQKKSLAASPWLKKEHTFTQGFLHPPSHSHKGTHRASSMREPKPRKQNADHDPYTKHTMNCKKIGCARRNSYGLTPLQHPISVREVEVEKKRHSSASARDIIHHQEVILSKERFCEGKSSSWEEEVRQAMARSSIGKRPSEDPYEGGGSACGLQRSVSVKNYAASNGGAVLPPTLIVKRKSSGGKVDAAVCTETGAKLMQDIEGGGRLLQRKSFAEEKGMWRAEFDVKTPSEERWEEAAEDEERQEMQRRARSQSMRYDGSREAELAGIGGCNAHMRSNVLYNDEESWAVYRKSGYVNVRPCPSSGAVAPCSSSLLGRSLSMRDTRMGLVMECAGCGAGGRLLCFCSCCAAAQACTQGTPPSTKKRGGSGILRACRRLFGLGKKRASDL